MSDPQRAGWMDNFFRQDIQEFAERGKELKLGTVYSGSPGHESEKERLEAVFDGLLRLFDINISDWQPRIEASAGTLTTTLGTIGEAIYDKRDVRRWARGKRLGEFIMEKAYWAVPIEGGEEDQTGRFILALKLDSHTFASIKSYGEQEVYRSYHDPETGSQVKGEIEDLEERAMKGELNTDIAAIHTNIAYSIVFSTQIPEPSRIWPDSD